MRIGHAPAASFPLFRPALGAVVRVVVGGLLIGGAVALVSNGVALADASAIITDSGYQPQVITIHAGESITWLNTGSSAHTVSAADGAFDSGSIAPGARWSVTLTELGTFVISSPADGFRGEVIVQAIDVTNPPLLTARPSLIPGSGDGPAPAGSADPATIAAVAVAVVVVGTAAFVLSRRRQRPADLRKKS